MSLMQLGFSENPKEHLSLPPEPNLLTDESTLPGQESPEPAKITSDHSFYAQ
jgi:hypothetical protein